MTYLTESQILNSALDVSTGALKIEAGAGGLQTGGVYNSTPPSLSNGQTTPLQLDSSGRVLTNPAPLTSASDSVVAVISPTRPITPALTQVASNASSVTILAANAGRKIATIFNDSTAILYLSLNAAVAASATIHTVQIPPGGYYELPQSATDGIYQGQITGIWASANGFARVTEIV